MVEITLKRKQIAKLPRYELGKKTFEEIGAVASDGVVLNVKDGKQITGARIKRNAPSTAAQKRAKRRLWRGRVASLIDKKHRFIRPGQGGSWRYWAYSNRVKIEPGNQELKRLSRWVQEKRYLGWFGLSQRVRRLIKAIVKKRLLEIVKKAPRRK